MLRSGFLATAVLLVGCALSNVAAQTAEPAKTQPDVPAQYAATAIGQAGPAAGKSFDLTVYVEQLTSDGDTEELVSTLKHKGQAGLLSAFEDIKDKGRLAPTGSVGIGMRFIRIHATKDGGQHIVLVTNRPISFGELYNGERSQDYPFGIVVMDVGKDGKGTGTFSPACKVRFNKKGELEIERYGQKPFRLANISRQK